jgi:hypothetical protein
MTCTIAHHTVIIASSIISVNIKRINFGQPLTAVNLFAFNDLMTELTIMEQEVSTALLFWQFSSDSFSFHNLSKFLTIPLL